jgi:phosphatidylinositol-3-phosphatase
VKNRRFSPGAVCIVTATLGLSPGVALPGPPAYDHVVIVIEENKGYDQIIGSSSGGAAPYINSLASQGALFTSYYAHFHPSQPNYIELLAGSNLGVLDDNRPGSLPLTAPNLGAELIAAGKTVAGYSEDLPSVGWDLADTYGNYVRRHNPIANWATANPVANQLPIATNRPFSGNGNFPANSSADFSSLPTVSIVDPNLKNDMHDGTITMGDTWLNNNMSGYINWAKTHNSLFVLTFDEDDSYQNQHIATILVGANVVPGTFDEPLSHVNLLRTIEDMYGTTHAGGAATAAPIIDVFGTGPARWAAPVSGNWCDHTKWSCGAAPNGAGTSAAFNTSTTATLTITLDAPQTIGTLVLGNSANYSAGYRLSGSSANVLTVNNSGSGALLTVTDGSHIIDATVLLADNLVVGGSGTLAFGDASTIKGNFALTMSGSGGTLILCGSNTYGGGTTVTAGTLQIGKGGKSGSFTGNVRNNAALVFNRSDTISFPGIISGEGSLTQAGPGVLTLTSSSLFWGSTIVSGGTLNVADNFALQGSTVVIPGGGRLVFDAGLALDAAHFGGLSGSGDLALRNNAAAPAGILLFVGCNWANSTYSGVMSGSGTLIKVGPGVQVLTGANTFSGGTAISGGTLQLGDGLSGHDGSMSALGGINDDAALVYNLAGSQSYAGTISGTGDMTKVGPGLLVLSGSNTYRGGTAVIEGTLIVAGYNAVLDGTSLTVGTRATQFFDSARGSSATEVSPATATVPEPSSQVLLGVAITMLLYFARRWRLTAVPPRPVRRRLCRRQ